MASLCKHHGGWLVQYVDGDKRRSFYPGAMPKRDAQAVKRHVENLLSARRQRTAVCSETAAWVESQDIAMRRKLHSHGLIEAPTEAAIEVMPLGDFCDLYIAAGSSAKESTRTVWKRAKRLLVTFYGESAALDSIDVSAAKEYRAWLMREGRRSKSGQHGPLAENTVRKMLSVASQIFADAVERELIVRNPFAVKGIPKCTRENRSRDFFITAEMAAAVLDACPDAEWRLLFALSRYGGLRCPSEHLSLRWEDVNWADNRIRITAPKTAHHEGRGERTIPLFPELLEPLESIYDAARPGTEFVITCYRRRNCNLRTRLERIIRRAGLAPWPKLFHNLRASRETELAETYPIHVVCAWLGNTPKVANKHYLQVTDDHFAKATSSDAVAMHYAMQQVTAGSGNGKKMGIG